MPPFPKPSFSFSYQVQTEIAALRLHKAKPDRLIPSKATNRLLLATWNIANLGVQERRSQDYQLIAEMISWFDIVAIQEVNDNLSGLRGIQQHLPTTMRTLFSDEAGNNERMAFIYDSTKVTLREKVGEIAIPPSESRYITLPGITQKFDGFDRNPYMAAFQAGSFQFLLVNVHLYYGSDSAVSMNRRSLETFAVARWADNRRKSPNCYCQDIIALGDFNLPKTKPGDPIFDALTSRGLHLPEHTSEVGSSIASDNHYDQIAFFPGQTSQEYTGNTGIFDFDTAVFSTLYGTNPNSTQKQNFFAYVRYYLSDHRIMWAEFKT
jgi:endonuclease/exonuclease/phosphatase family metal-dependent hydrolase